MPNPYDVEDAGGGYGTEVTQFDPASDPNTNPNTSTDINSPFKRGDVFTNQTVMDPSAGIAGLKKFVTDNKAYLAGAGTLALYLSDDSQRANDLAASSYLLSKKAQHP